jgi:putative membrane protein
MDADPSSPAPARPGHTVAGNRSVTAIAALFAALWLALAIQPRHRADWALENALVVLGVLGLALARRRLVLSRLSYTLVFAFLSLHAVGAHYTYSEVPYDAWVAALTGRGLDAMLGWQRNNFDRIVHLAYGLLLTYPLRETVVRMTGLRGFWSYLLPMALMMSSSAGYELVEWGAATVFGGDLGLAYVGAQGDPWDAQKDMSLAALGAALTSAAIAAKRGGHPAGAHRLRRPAARR